MDHVNGDVFGIVLQYTTLHETIRLLRSVHGNSGRLPLAKLRKVLSNGALRDLITRIGTWLLFCPILQSIGALTPTPENFQFIWKTGMMEIPKRCDFCYSIVRWKSPGWTPDAKLVCWWHYQKTHHKDIKTTLELAKLCSATRIPRSVQHKYEELGMKTKKTGMGARLYYIPPIKKIIREFSKKKYGLITV